MSNKVMQGTTTSNDTLKVFTKSKHRKFLYVLGISMCLGCCVLYYISIGSDEQARRELVNSKSAVNSSRLSFYNVVMSPLKNLRGILNADNNRRPKGAVLFPDRVDKKFIILYWTTIFLRNTWNFHKSLDGCPEMKAKCEFSYNRSLQTHEADMLILHMRDSYEKPVKPPHQKWLFYLQESPINTHINLKVEKFLFNLTNTYRLDSDFHALYGNCQIDPKGNIDGLKKAPNYAKGKKFKVAWFVSNCRTRNKRMEYVNNLGKYTEVHQYGCGSKYSCPVNKGAWCDKVLLNNEYKFYLSFENSFCKDYVTEKLFRIIGQINVVPIVSGWFNYTKHLPPHSFIDVKDFASPKHLGDYINIVNANDTLYNEYFAWRHTTKWTCKLPHSSTGCDICRHGIENRQKIETVDIYNFWNRRTTCQPYNTFYRGM